MVKLNKIYTRTGDGGTTGLGNGERRPKHDLRVRAYGSVDSLNASLGLACLHADANHPFSSLLTIIQNDLFDLGADLCVPITQNEEDGKALRIIQAQIDRLEAAIDQFNDALAPLTSFILPGGTPLAAALHVSRTKARESEQLVSALADSEDGHLNPLDLVYLNRLSDLLFVLARYSNEKGEKDVLWIPGAHRQL